jgi:hypothetical protein
MATLGASELAYPFRQVAYNDDSRCSIEPVTTEVKITNPRFDSEYLGEYMRQKVGVSRDDPENAFNFAIDNYVRAAWAVKDYLEANSL